MFLRTKSPPAYENLRSSDTEQKLVLHRRFWFFTEADVSAVQTASDMTDKHEHQELLRADERPSASIVGVELLLVCRHKENVLSPLGPWEPGVSDGDEEMN